MSSSDLEYAHDKMVLGQEHKSREKDMEELKITAYHEAGHTIVAHFTKDASPVHKVRSCSFSELLFIANKCPILGHNPGKRPFRRSHRFPPP